MTSVVQEHTLATLQQDRRTTALGLLWGGVLMVVLAVWLPAKHPEISIVVPGVTWILAVAAFVAALGLFAARLHSGTPDEQRQLLLSRRRPVGVVLTVSGLVLLLLSVYLAWTFGLTAFAESGGALLLGLIALAAGVARLRPPDRSIGHNQILQFLLERRDPLRFVLFGLAAVLLLVGGIWGLRVHHMAGFPEWGAAFLIAFVALGGGIWLSAGVGRTVTLAQMRLFVLICGGLTGLAVAAMTILRGVTLWGEFSRGTAGWSGPESWRLWLVVYVEMIGLALMFASLSLAQVEIRVNAGLRRLLYGYNALLTGLLLLTILTVVNILVYVAYPFTFDWTKSGGLHDLSRNSKQLLENLREPTKVYVVMAPGYPGYDDLHLLLDNAQSFTDRLQVEYVSPDRFPRRYKELLDDYPELARDRTAKRQDEEMEGRGVLVVYGPESKKADRKVPHSFINASALVDVKLDRAPSGGANKQTRLFKGEQVIMTELQFLMENKKKPKVYFLQGDGEHQMNDVTRGDTPQDGGLGMFVERLKTENYEVRGLAFRPLPRDPRNPMPDISTVLVKAGPDGKKDVPADAKVVVAAGPKLPLEKEELDALDRFVGRGGKLVLLIDLEGARRDPRQDPRAPVVPETPLAAWLKKYNVDLTQEFVYSTTEEPYFVHVVPAPESRNPIAKSFRRGDEAFTMFIVRVVKPLPNPASPYLAEALLQVSTKRLPAFTDKRMAVFGNPFPYWKSRQANGNLDTILSNDALPVAVAVTDRDQKPVLIVMGTSYFVTNWYMQQRVSRAYDLQANFLEWLAERPGGLDIRPKETGSYAINPEISRAQVVFLPAWLMAVGIIGLGTGIWIVRRR